MAKVYQRVSGDPSAPPITVEISDEQFQQQADLASKIYLDANPDVKNYITNELNRNRTPVTDENLYNEARVYFAEHNKNFARPGTEAFRLNLTYAGIGAAPGGDDNPSPFKGETAETYVNKISDLGMRAYLGVAQGSTADPYGIKLAHLGDPGNKENNIWLIGKGITFDSGGLSLKPSFGMLEMKSDMSGGAAVITAMEAISKLNPKINVVGLCLATENMPDGGAQRVGDIVKSMSGKTIEILNTDAEGRLVLADALTFTEKKYKPRFIIDLATLTGAIIVSLGSEYAGLFSNNDKLSNELINAGEKVNEKLWRMPLHKNYDKLINSKNADMQNINYVGGAGSTTAAQFLQRFILNKTPWAHLDIAGMAFSKYGGALNSGGATGYGVRLLNQLVEDNYE